MMIRERILNRLDETMDNRSEISKEEYEKIKARHATAKSDSTRYHNVAHFYRRNKATHKIDNAGPEEQKRTYRVMQTHSHWHHKIPTIEADENGKHWKYPSK